MRLQEHHKRAAEDAAYIFRFYLTDRERAIGYVDWLREQVRGRRHNKYALDDSGNYGRFVGVWARAMAAVREGEIEVIPDFTVDEICDGCAGIGCRTKERNRR